MICMMAASVTGVYAQRSDRSFIRKGNRMFEDSLFIKAEENYLKAVDMNPEMYREHLTLAIPILRNKSQMRRLNSTGRQPMLLN